MRDLSPLAPASQDVVYQPYSLGFVPDASAVFAQVARVLRPGGIYFFAVANPFTCGLSPEDWTGDGYALRLPYVPGAMVTVPDPDWVYARGASIQTAPPPSREYRHTLGTLLNGLTERGFRLVHLSDSKDFHADPDAEPGTWGHFVSVAPPWLAFWLRREPR
jgi:SAM-dependent methyltransferase